MPWVPKESAGIDSRFGTGRMWRRHRGPASQDWGRTGHSLRLRCQLQKRGNRISIPPSVAQVQYLAKCSISLASRRVWISRSSRRADSLMIRAGEIPSQSVRRQAISLPYVEAGTAVTGVDRSCFRSCRSKHSRRNRIRQSEGRHLDIGLSTSTSIGTRSVGSMMGSGHFRNRTWLAPHATDPDFAGGWRTSS